MPRTNNNNFRAVLLFLGLINYLVTPALSQLFTYLRQHPNFSIICFCSFTLEQLQVKCDPAIKQVLSLIDVLIDGQYMPELNDNKGTRGFSNQIVHFLSGRHASEANLFTERKRDVEIHVRDDSALMVGVPPINFPKHFKKALNFTTPKLSSINS